MLKIQKTLVLMMFVTITNISFGQVAFGGTWKGEHLRGQVKSIKTTIYYANDKFGEITKGDVYSWVLWRFDTKGEGTEKTDSKESNFKYNSKYDNQSRLTEQNAYSSAGTLALKTLNKYDNEKISQTISYDENGNLYEKYLYKYDNNTQNCETSRYNSSGDLNYKCITDKNRNILETSEYSYGSIDTKLKYEYSNAGKLNRVLTYNSENTLVKEYVYNENGDIIIEKSYDYSYDEDYNDITTEKIEYTYKYKYDNKGNWTEQILFKSEADIAISITAREIEYYK